MEQAAGGASNTPHKNSSQHSDNILNPKRTKTSSSKLGRTGSKIQKNTSDKNVTPAQGLASPEILPNPVKKKVSGKSTKSGILGSLSGTSGVPVKLKGKLPISTNTSPSSKAVQNPGKLSKTAKITPKGNKKFNITNVKYDTNSEEKKQIADAFGEAGMAREKDMDEFES